MSLGLCDVCLSTFTVVRILAFLFTSPTSVITQTTTILKTVHFLFSQRKKAANFWKKFCLFQMAGHLKIKADEMERTYNPYFTWPQLANED